MATKTIRDYYKIMLVSQPGKGKTYSFRNMDPDTTGFINSENKPLPFRHSFKYHAKPKRFAGALKAIEDFSANNELESIVIDSISSIFEMLLEEMRANFRGFDIWTNYNMGVTKLLNLIKAAPKEIIITAHYEIINMEGEAEKRVKTKGKEFEGMIEKEFTIVLYGDSKFKDEKAEYFFRLAGEGMSAKCPPDIFGEGVIKIPNDCKMILEKVVTFAKLSEKEDKTVEIFS